MNTLATLPKGLFSLDGHIIACGPLSKQPQTMPYRIVLLGYPNGSFSVHSQIFKNEKAENYTEFLVSGSSLESGFYFDKDEIVKATLKFAETVSLHAGSLGCLYRGEITHDSQGVRFGE